MLKQTASAAELIVMALFGHPSLSRNQSPSRLWLSPSLSPNQSPSRLRPSLCPNPSPNRRRLRLSPSLSPNQSPYQLPLSLSPNQSLLSPRQAPRGWLPPAGECRHGSVR